MAIHLISIKDTHKYIFPKGDFTKPIDGELIPKGKYINPMYNATHNGINYIQDNPDLNDDVIAYLKSDFRELTHEEIKAKYYTTPLSVKIKGVSSVVGISAIPVAATYLKSKENKIENTAIAAAIIGGVGISLINSKSKGGYSIGWETDPFYGGIGLGLSISSIGYLIAKKAFKASTKNAFIAGGLLLAASIYYFNPKFALPIDRDEYLMQLNNEPK